MPKIVTACLLYFIVFPTITLASESNAGPTQEVVSSPVADFRIFNAAVEAEHQATVSSQTTGKIIEINFDVDDYVKKGAVLLRLAGKEQKSRLANVQSAMKEAQANAEQAKKEFVRVKSIYAKKLVAKSVLDKATAANKAASARLKAARAKVDEVREQWEHSVIRAPYSGIVVKRFVQVGESVRVGQALMTGLSLEHLRVVVDFPQSLVSKLRHKASLAVISPGDNGKRIPIDAADVTIFPYADTKTYSFRVRLKLPGGLDDFYPGMMVKVALETGRIERIMIPASAVVYRGEVEALYVLGKAGKVFFRQVRVGERQGKRVTILAGLRKGDTLLLDPLKAVSALKSQQTK